MNHKEVEQNTILSLLPYNEHTQLVNKKQKLEGLHFLKSIIHLSIKGLEHFIQGNLSQFDAQLGENLCQIRAYRILCIWKFISSSSQLKNHFIEKINSIKSYQKKLDNVIIKWKEYIARSSSYNRELDGPENINYFLDKNDLFLELDEELIFVISCFFLAYFNIRSENIPIAINLELISTELNVSKYRAKRLTHKYQQTVCKLGCDFIMKIANELESTSNYLEVLPKFYQVSDEDRVVLPCYMTSEVIFHHSIKEKIPIFLCVNRKNKSSKKLKDVIYFLLVSNGEQQHFSLVSCEDFSMSYCIAISGDMEFDILENPQRYVINFLQQDPFKLILANTATHPQYSGKKLSKYRNDPFLMIGGKEITNDMVYHRKNLMDMKKFAVDIGCSKENPSIFFLRHIYASQVMKEVNELKPDVPSYEAYKMFSYQKYGH